MDLLMLCFLFSWVGLLMMRRFVSVVWPRVRVPLRRQSATGTVLGEAYELP